MSYAIHTSSNFVDCCCSFVHLLITQWVVLKVNRITGNFRLISNYISLWWILYIILSLYYIVKWIKLVCADCKFMNPNENALDTLIYGLTSRRIQSKLLETDENTTLAAAVEIAQQYEATARQLDDIHGGEPSGVQTVHAVHTTSKSYASTQLKEARHP